MKIRLSDYEITMNSGRTYAAAKLLTPKNPNGDCKTFDTLAVFYVGTVDAYDDLIEAGFDMVDYEWGGDDMTADEIWSFLVTTAEEDDKRRDITGR